MTDAAAPPDGAGSLDTRVAVLEERTTPKPRTWGDRIKDWGGVASLVLALAYSFPLGVWDRFIAAEKKRVAEEIAVLRTVVDQSTVIMSDGARALSGTQDPFLYDTIGRAVNTRLYVLMAKHKPEFEKHRQAFTAPELLVIGYNFLNAGHGETALAFFDVAEQKAGTDLASRIEALRQRAKVLFIQGPLQDRARARITFQDALTRLEQARNFQATQMHASLLAEWALFELLDGDWACGQEKLVQADAELARLAPYMNDKGNLARLVAERTRVLQRQPQQPASGCGPGGPRS